MSTDAEKQVATTAGQVPVVLAILTHRQDPKKPGVINYRSMAAFALVSSHDEAVGIGVRRGQQAWPTAEGWGIPCIAVRPLTKDEATQALACYPNVEDDQVPRC